MRAFSILPAQTVVVLIFDFVLGVSLYGGIYYVLHPEIAGAYLFTPDAWLRILLAVFSVLAGLFLNELYRVVRVHSRVALSLQLSHVFGLSLIGQTLLAYINANLALPRLVVLIATVLGFPAFFIWRLLYSGFLWKLFGQQKIILVGNGTLAQELAKQIFARPDRAIRLAGYVGDPSPEAMLDTPYLGPFEQLAALAADLKPDRVVVACAERRDGGMPIEQLLEIRRRGVPIEEGAQLYERICSRICSSEFRPAHFIFDQTLVHRPGSLALQSIYSNLLALASIIVLIPLMIVLAILVKISTGGPILHSVSCTGYRGIPFTLKRFRVTRKVPGANRIGFTRLGHFLRRTHLDLLPALFNLLRGELALVGPRPNREEIAEELSARIPFYEQRYSLKPGLTGWSQINMETSGRPSDALISLEYDLYYLKNMSLSLDAYILLRRLRHVLSSASA